MVDWVRAGRIGRSRACPVQRRGIRLPTKRQADGAKSTRIRESRDTTQQAGPRPARRCADECRWSRCCVVRSRRSSFSDDSTRSERRRAHTDHVPGPPMSSKLMVRRWLGLVGGLWSPFGLIRLLFGDFFLRALRRWRCRHFHTIHFSEPAAGETDRRRASGRFGTSAPPARSPPGLAADVDGGRLTQPRDNIAFAHADCDSTAKERRCIGDTGIAASGAAPAGGGCAGVTCLGQAPLASTRSFAVIGRSLLASSNCS